MEINFTDKQKLVIEGVIRSGVFLVAMRKLSLLIGEYITIPIVGAIFNAINFIFDKPYEYLTRNIVLSSFAEGLGFIIVFLSLFFICIISSTYITGKILCII